MQNYLDLTASFLILYTMLYIDVEYPDNRKKMTFLQESFSYPFKICLLFM